MCSTISAYIMFPLYIAEVSNEVSYQRNFREKRKDKILVIYAIGIKLSKFQ